MKKASSFLNYFEPFLGRIEIQGSSGRIERVYFEIKESNIEQWNKPQIKDSKRQFLFDIVNESDEKEKLENFVNFCEDTIFEMQHAASISTEPSEEATGGGEKSDQSSLFRKGLELGKTAFFSLFRLLSPSYMRGALDSLKQSNKKALFFLAFRLLLNLLFFFSKFVFNCIRVSLRCLYLIIVENNNGKVKPGVVMVDTSPEAPLVFGYREEMVQKSSGATPKPFGIDLNKAAAAAAAGLDPNNSGGGGDSSTDGGEFMQELEVYQQLPEEFPETAAAAAAKEASAAKKTKVDYRKLLEEADEDVPSSSAGGGEESTASAAATTHTASNYKQILSMFARNFYKMKILALILAFLINFLMMFYKARMIDPEVPGQPVFLEPGDDGEENEAAANLIEVIMMDPEEYYIEHLLKAFAFIHSTVAFGMVVAYYVLKVPLVIFKREKEVARKLEFQGMWISEQPGDDDLRSHWDKLVLSTRTYPQMYWDKFIKKKVKAKYAEQFDVEQLCKLMGISAREDEFNLDEMNASKAASARSDTGGWFSK